MRPANNRVSASSLQTLEECPAKYKALYVDYIPQGGGNTPANEGTALHYALEKFVEETCIKKTHDWSDVARLKELYTEGWKSSFGTNLVNKEIAKEAFKILKQWHDRHDFTDIEVLSVESKEFMPIKDRSGNPYGIDLTYIFDRCDFYTDPNTGLKTLKVVDYKSVRMRWTHDEVSKKIQPLIYAMAALTKYQNLNPDSIWVEIDLLRFNETIGVRFTREDCIRTYRYLQDTIQDLLNIDPDKVPYTIGPGCRYCPIKITCPSLIKNANSGGTLGNIVNTDIKDVVKTREELKARLDALSSLIGDLDDQIFEYAKENDSSSFNSGDFDVKLTSVGKRAISDMEVVAKILGPQIMEREGRINVTDIDRLAKNGEITEDQVKKIQPFMEKKYGSPSVKISRKGPME